MYFFKNNFNTRGTSSIFGYLSVILILSVLYLFTSLPSTYIVYVTFLFALFYWNSNEVVLLTFGCILISLLFVFSIFYSFQNTILLNTSIEYILLLIYSYLIFGVIKAMLELIAAPIIKRKSYSHNMFVPK